MSKKVKIFAGIVIALAAIIGGASYLGSRKDAAPISASPLSSTTGVIPLPGVPSSQTTSADEFSKVLGAIQNITIDTSLFQNKAYTLLRDFPVSLGSDTVGRVNPFAPIGVDSSAPVTGDVTVQTLQTGKITKNTAEVGAQVLLNTTAPTTIIFEYGTSDTFGNSTSPVLVKKNTTVLSTLSGLAPDTTYYVRAVSLTGATTTTANTTSFVTAKK